MVVQSRETRSLLLTCWRGGGGVEWRDEDEVEGEDEDDCVSLPGRLWTDVSFFITKTGILLAPADTL
jgi:hypothetical protein